MDKSERYRADVKYVIDKVELPLDDPEVETAREFAKDLYDKFHDSVEMNLLSQFEEELFARAALYLATQHFLLPVAMNEVGPTDDLGSYTRKIREQTGFNTLPTPPEVFVERYADELDLEDEVREEASNLAADFISSRRPKTIAISAIYTAALLTGNRRTQSDLSNHTGVSEVSIRDCYDDMRAVA